MITNKDVVNQVQRSDNIMQEANFHIDASNMSHITAVLRDMYSDPELAVLREYCANALDAHIMARIEGTMPIRVTLPTILDPTFRVRDFGPGLDVDATTQLLCGYGASGEHKRSSNTQIGGFGIGCKCAFSISDQFQFIVHHGGKKRTWSCYLDETDVGKAALMNEEDTDETGIEAVVPISTSAISSFVSKALDAFKYYPIKPEMHGLDDSIGLKPSPGVLYQGTVKIAEAGRQDAIINWRILDNPEDNETFVMGSLPYPVNTGLVVDDINVPKSIFKPQTGKAELLRDFLNPFQFVVPIGWVQPAPNREALQYSQKTKKRLAALYSYLLSEKFITSFFDKLVSETVIKFNLVLAIGKFRSFIIDDTSKEFKTKVLNELNKAGVGFDGFNMPSKIVRDVGFTWYTGKFMPSRNWSRGSGGYHNYWRVSAGDRTSLIRSGISTQETAVLPLVNVPYGYYGNRTTAAPEKPIVLVVPKISGLLSVCSDGTYDSSVERLGKLVLTMEQFNIKSSTTEASRGLLILEMDDTSKLDELKTKLSWLGDGSCEIVFEADLPDKVDAELFQTRASKSRSSSSSYNSNRNTYAQHSRKYVTLKPDAATYSEPASKNWNPANAKDLKDGVPPFVYVAIDRFMPRINLGDTICGRKDLSTANLKGAIVANVDLGILPELLYGIRVKDVKDLTDDFVPLVDYLKGEYSTALKAKDITPDQISWAIMKNYIKSHHSRTEWSHVIRGVCKIHEQPVVTGLRGTTFHSIMQRWDTYAPKAATPRGQKLLQFIDDIWGAFEYRGMAAVVGELDPSLHYLVERAKEDGDSQGGDKYYNSPTFYPPVIEKDLTTLATEYPLMLAAFGIGKVSGNRDKNSRCWKLGFETTDSTHVVENMEGGVKFPYPEATDIVVASYKRKEAIRKRDEELAVF